MRIAFTHNLQLSTAEEEAEFDTPHTVALITSALRAAGHEVEPVEVSGPASRTVARLEALAPDLVFNTAEGNLGRFREAFHPALFDRLALPFTGSDAYVCALTLDKQLTKLILSAHGVPSPKGVLIERVSDLNGHSFRYPVIAKPNYEGSSKGITVDSVVDGEEALRDKVIELLARFPAGILCEEFIVGKDVVVPWLEKASPETGGVLEPASYEYKPEYASRRKYQLYDFDLKVLGFDGLVVHVPAGLPDKVRTEAMLLTRKTVRALGIRDVCRLDFRLSEDGQLYFLEINALPSLEDGASIYLSSRRVGLDGPSQVLETIVKSASERYGLQTKARARRRRATVRVGITFNLKGTQFSPNSREDSDAEYDTPETVGAIRKALESFGHEVVELEATPELPAILPVAGVDVVFNIAAGFFGRARESQVPALLELLGLEYTGSDPTALSLALDKGLAKRLVREAGVLTPAHTIMVSGKERLPKELTFPLIVKPLAEGSSKGVVEASVAENEAQLRERAREVAQTYRQAVLVENYLPGREFTIALLGEKRPHMLPPLEVVFTDPSRKYPIYTYEAKVKSLGVRFETPAKIDDVLKRELERVGRAVFAALSCRDLARIDVRLDAHGRVNFLECNPLPGLVPGFSDLCVMAEAAGQTYRTLIGEILAPALRRLRERRKERVIEART